MTAIDKDFLEAELKSVRLQKERARDVFSQACGAEQLLLSLIERVDAQTQEELKTTGTARKGNTPHG